MTMPSAQFPDLKDRTVLVTGGGSGIGAALVEGFLGQDARVAFIDIDGRASRALVERLGSAGSRVPLFLEADLGDIPALRQAVERVEAAFGPVTVLVNNAARDDRQDFGAVTAQDWDDNLAVNLRPSFFTAQAVAPMMKAAGGGAIVNFSSIAFMLNMGELPAYASAKAGIIGLTKSLAGTLGPDNIRVNAILPGMVLTERQKSLWVTGDAAAAMVARQCLKFSLQPEDMVGPTLYLASDLSRAMTAQTMIIDGGCL